MHHESGHDKKIEMIRRTARNDPSKSFVEF
jgi:hypothetical protein